MLRRAAADHGRRDPKRLIGDHDFRDRVELASELGIATSELNAWDPVDRDNALGLKRLHAESCSGCGIHPSQQYQFVPDWKHCRICELLEHAREAGPPSEDKGYHLTLKRK